MAHQVRLDLIRLGFMINADIQEILAVRVTNEKTGDSLQLEDLLDTALENRSGEAVRGGDRIQDGHPPPEPVIEIRADGGYDTREIFKYCAKLGVMPIINIRINSNSRANGVSRDRSTAVLEQLSGDGGPNTCQALTRANAW